MQVELVQRMMRRRVLKQQHHQRFDSPSPTDMHQSHKLPIGVNHNWHPTNLAEYSIPVLQVLQ